MTQPLPRQTLSYLRGLLEERGIHPKNKLGQNFLIDLNLIDLIVRTAELSRDDLALEVGTGTGSLTARLADLAGAVLSIEIDSHFHELAKELLYGRDNVTLLLADVLRNKNDLNPALMAKLAELRQASGCSRMKLVANLPYVVATPVIGNFLVAGTDLERMVVMVQWEIAERLTAAVKTKEYSSLAVFVQSVADVTVVRRLAPGVFWPRPQVDSAIVMIRPNAAKRAQVGDVVRFRTFLRDLYTHRRKNLRGALSGWPSGRRPKDEVDAKLAELGFDGNLRAEDLDLDEHRALSEMFG
jgi:16S rRNA (adenine1518-N6/adenine1519-N6)-dimethyltransferase